MVLSGRYPVCFVVPSCIAGLPAVLLWTLTSFSFGSSYMKQRHSYGLPSSLSSILPLAVLKSRLVCRVRISSRVYFITILEKIMTTSISPYSHPRFHTFSSFLLLSDDERPFHWAPTHACTQICSEPSPRQRTSLSYHAVATRGPWTPARLLFFPFFPFSISRAWVCNPPAPLCVPGNGKLTLMIAGRLLSLAAISLSATRPQFAAEHCDTICCARTLSQWPKRRGGWDGLWRYGLFACRSY
jgi:hypothetical protein